MTKTFTYDLTISDTSLRLSLEEITDPAAWEPLDRCAGEPFDAALASEIWLTCDDRCLMRTNWK